LHDQPGRPMPNTCAHFRVKRCLLPGRSETSAPEPTCETPHHQPPRYLSSYRGMHGRGHVFFVRHGCQRPLAQLFQTRRAAQISRARTWRTRDIGRLDGVVVPGLYPTWILRRHSAVPVCTGDRASVESGSSIVMTEQLQPGRRSERLASILGAAGRSAD